MSYATFDYCEELYPDLTEKEYNLYSWETKHEIDKHTSGVDGVKKLKIAFPTDEDNAEAVKRCFAHLLYSLAQIGRERTNLAKASEPIEINGQIAMGPVSSVSSGSESISFASGTQKSSYYMAATDPKEKSKLIVSIIREYLSEVKDDNGINLLYGGVYPCIKTR